MTYRFVDYYAQVVRNDLLYFIKPVILDRVVCKRVPEALFVGMSSWRQLPCIEVRSLATNQILFTTANDQNMYAISFPPSLPPLLHR